MQNSNGTALITGAGQGIGRAIAQTLSAAGFRIVGAEIDPEAGAETEAELRAGGGQAIFIPTDVADETSVRQMVERAIGAFGRLDVLVNNAGIFRQQPLSEFSFADWQRVIGTNLTGAFLCSKYAEPHLRASKGAIVNVASTRALMSEPNTEAYSASKGGLVALTHALAMTLAPVRVNCISPGWIDVSGWKKRSARKSARLREIDHRQHPVGRVGKPEDVARLVAYLASPEAEFITGQNFVIDGGMARKMIYAE